METTHSKHQSRRRTGELLADEGLVHPGDIEPALAIQEKNRTSLTRNKHRLFGMILCDLNLITPTDTYCVLKKHGKLKTIPDYLIQNQLLTRPEVEKALTRSVEANIPFMSLLLEEKILSKTRVRQIAFDLFHLPFRSISDIVFDADTRPGLSLIIKKDLARQHQVIPLALKENSLVCGITDPDNLIFIRDLNDQFPQYRFKPLFIPFSGFTWFYKMLYEEAWDSEKAMEKPVDLSLLLKFCVTITEPARERSAIDSLYKRYELVRSLIGCPGKGDRAGMFQAFIGEHHKNITQKYHCRSIEFSLKNDPKRLRIMAFPKEQVK
jgi:hypothetical protein